MGEGKSTVSSFLAIAAALHKKLRVLLIDADLRRPSVHKLFNLDIAPGITDLKTLGKEWIDVARQVRGVAGLSVLTVGGSDELPTEQIESGIVQQVVASANKWFDLIIADSPPMLPVNDALQLAPAFDGVLLVTKAGETSKDLTKTAIDTLKRHDIALLGVTLNNVLGVMPHYYGHYSYTRAEE
jgi:capsular exopolysaccharide synthesis family protein